MAYTCAFSGSYFGGCDWGEAGISKLYIAPMSSINTITKANGQITAISPSASFFTFVPAKETAAYTETMTMDTTGRVQTVEISLPFKINADDYVNRELLSQITRTDVYVIAEQTDGQLFFIGANRFNDKINRGANIKLDYASGQAYGDAARGNTLTIMSKVDGPALNVTSSIAIQGVGGFIM